MEMSDASYFIVPILAGMIPLVTGVVMVLRYRVRAVLVVFIPAAIFVPVWAAVQALNIHSGSGDFSGFAVIAPLFFSILNGVYLSIVVGALSHLIVHRFVSRRSRGSVVVSWVLLAAAGGLFIWKGWMFYAWPWSMDRF